MNLEEQLYRTFVGDNVFIVHISSEIREIFKSDYFEELTSILAVDSPQSFQLKVVHLYELFFMHAIWKEELFYMPSIAKVLSKYYPLLSSEEKIKFLRRMKLRINHKYFSSKGLIPLGAIMVTYEMLRSNLELRNDEQFMKYLGECVQLGGKSDYQYYARKIKSKL